MKPWWMTKSNPYQGLKAKKIRGSSSRCEAPSTKMVANQSSITGPNSCPTRRVPRDCTKKRAKRMTMLMVITTPVVTLSLIASMVRRPSTALSTEIAGVITESP